MCIYTSEYIYTHTHIYNIMDETGIMDVLGFRIPILVAVTSLFGALALLCSYVAGLFSRQTTTNASNKGMSNVSGRNEGSDRNSMGSDSSSIAHNSGTTTSNSVNANSDTTSGKRAKNKKRREAQQEFAHPWMIGALKGHTEPVLDMNFSSNGKFLVSCSEDRSVQIWCTKDFTCKDRKSVRINLGYDHATHVRWSPDGKAFIVHNATGNSIDVWKLVKSTKKGDSSFKSATKVLEFPKKHEEDIVGMDISCNGRYIITCSKANDLIVWDLKGEQLANIDTYLGSTHRAKISPCGRFVAASGFTPDVKVWEVGFTKTGEFKQISKAFDLAGHSSGIYDFNFCADTSHMATVSKDGTYRFYDTKIEFEKGENPRLLSKGAWDVATPASIAVSPNGEVIVIAHGSSLTFYSTAAGSMDANIEYIFNDPITCIAFDAAGEYVLVGGDKQIKIFHNVTGYRAAIQSACRKLEHRQTSATKERLEETISKCKIFLAEMGEPFSQ